MRTIYLCGPMSGYANYNREAFSIAAKNLRLSGYKVNSPAELEAPGDEPEHDSWYAKHCIPMMLESDMVVVLPGWELSFGAPMELDIAYHVGIKAYRMDNDIYTKQSVSNVKWTQPVELPHITTTARHLLCRSRNSDYGDPRWSWRDIAQDWGCSSKEAVLSMAQMKIRRELNNPKRDNLVDAIGYLIIADMLKDGAK